MNHKHKFEICACGEKRPAPVKRGLTPFQKQHATPYCYCIDCLPKRKQECLDQVAAMIADGRLSPTWETDPIAKPEPQHLKSIREIQDHLSVCVCGHTAVLHDTDAMENLLSCSHSAKCGCDHFRCAPVEVAA